MGHSKEYSGIELRQMLSKILAIDPSRGRPPITCENTDDQYKVRNDLVHKAVHFARLAGYKAGYVIHQPIDELSVYKEVVEKVRKEVFSMFLDEDTDYEQKVYSIRDIVKVYNIRDIVDAYRVAKCTPSWDPRWGVVAIINLPEGQVSWHMDSHDLKWDGHTDREKWEHVVEHLRNTPGDCWWE